MHRMPGVFTGPCENTRGQKGLPVAVGMLYRIVLTICMDSGMRLPGTDAAGCVCLKKMDRESCPGDALRLYIIKEDAPTTNPRSRHMPPNLNIISRQQKTTNSNEADARYGRISGSLHTASPATHPQQA